MYHATQKKKSTPGERHSSSKIILLIADVKLVAAIAVVALVAGAAFLMKIRQVSINASYDQAAQQLASAGYTVTVLTDAEELASYSADGLTAAVIAYKGSEKLSEPDKVTFGADHFIRPFYQIVTSCSKTVDNALFLADNKRE